MDPFNRTLPVNRTDAGQPTTTNGTGVVMTGTAAGPSGTYRPTVTSVKTTGFSRAPGTAAAAVTTVASTGWSNEKSMNGEGGEGGTLSGATITTAATTTTTTTTTVQSTFFGGGVKETDTKSGVGSGAGGYDYGGGHRYGGGYDERDGETMMTTPVTGVFGGDGAFPPAAKPMPPKNAEPPINTKAAESTAFVVLVTAATLIIIVLIILLVLKVKYRTDTNRYKIEMPKGYGVPVDHDRGGLCHQQQNANLLSPGNYPPSRQSSSSPTYVQNSYRPYSAGGVNNKPKKRQDVKEWYV